MLLCKLDGEANYTIIVRRLSCPDMMSAAQNHQQIAYLARESAFTKERIKLDVHIMPT